MYSALAKQYNYLTAIRILISYARYFYN